MKIDFSILWVDDNTDFIDSLLPRLESWIGDNGFILTVHKHKNETGMLENLKNNEIELIVIDQKLPKKNGDQLIKEIRAKHYYQDIIFYSQGGPPIGVFKTPPDGVFFVDRQYAKDRIKDLIELKIKRASDLATLRGWVVADAIVLETLLGKVLCKCFKGHKEIFEKCVLMHEGLFDFYKKHMVLNNLLHERMDELQKNSDTTGLSKLKTAKKILDGFSDEIVHIRNALAHQVAEDGELGHKKVKVKGKAKEFLNTKNFQMLWFKFSVNRDFLSKPFQIRSFICPIRDDLSLRQPLTPLSISLYRPESLQP